MNGETLPEKDKSAGLSLCWGITGINKELRDWQTHAYTAISNYIKNANWTEADKLFAKFIFSNGRTVMFSVNVMSTVYIRSLSINAYHNEQ